VQSLIETVQQELKAAQNDCKAAQEAAQNDCDAFHQELEAAQNDRNALHQKLEAAQNDRDALHQEVETIHAMFGIRKYATHTEVEFVKHLYTASNLPYIKHQALRLHEIINNVPQNKKIRTAIERSNCMAMDEIQRISYFLRDARLPASRLAHSWSQSESTLDVLHEQLAATVTSELSPESALKFRGLMDGWKKDFHECTRPPFSKRVVWWAVC
jgi:DNA repair exonuclease SbcCD ATPase subunit